MEGFGRFTYEIVKRLVENYPEYTFYFFFDRPYDQKFLFAKNVVPVVLRPPARHPILFKIWFNWSVTRALKKYSIDLFFSPDGYLSLKTVVPQFAVIHDLNFEHYPKDIPTSPRQYLSENFPKFADKAKHIFTVSEFSKKDLIDTYHLKPNKITVAYNAANEIFKPQLDEVKIGIRQEFTNNKPFFLYVGAIHARKNVKRLLKAFKQYKDETNSETKLLITGEPIWEKIKLETEIKDVVFTGHVAIEKLAEIIGSAKALCLVSYFEGFGIPLVEAMQSGVPVIAGNLTSLPEVCGEAGYLVDPFDINDISLGLKRIDEDQLLRTKMIKSGLKQAQKFSWDESVKKIGSILFP